MKAISLKQPYATWVANGSKTIETRKWTTEYRGRLLIVSSKNPDLLQSFPTLEEQLDQFPLGYALATVELVDCRPMTKSDELAALCEIYPKAHAWILEDPKTFHPFKVKGALSIFEVEVPDDLDPETKAILSQESLYR
jgi:hypothetical protein